MTLLPQVPPDQVLLLDVGGVILLSAWEILLHEHAAAKAQSELLGPFSRGADEDWNRWHTGELTEHEYWAGWEVRIRESRIEAFHGVDDPIRKIYSACQQPVRRNVARRARRLVHAGIRVVPVSNGIRRRIGVEWFERQPLLRFLGRLVEAETVGARKPSLEFFEACAQREGVELCELSLVDDNPDYARAAARLGLKGYWFRISERVESVPVD